MLYDACCWVLASALWDMAAAAALVKNSKGSLATDTAAQASERGEGQQNEGKDSKGSLPTDTAAQASGRGEGQWNKGKDSTAGGIAGARLEEQG